MFEGMFGHKKPSPEEIVKKRQEEELVKQAEIKERIAEKVEIYNKKKADGTLSDIGKSEYGVKHIDDVNSLSIEDNEGVGHNPYNSESAFRVFNDKTDSINTESMATGEMKAFARENKSENTDSSLPIEPPAHWKQTKESVERDLEELEKTEFDDDDYPKIQEVA